MLTHAGMKKKYWGEAVMTATFLRNRCPTRAINQAKSPYQIWTTKKPILTNLKVFGCHAYVHVPREKRSKLDSKSSLCRFLGYAEHEKSYRFEEVSTGKIKVSRDAQFKEDTFEDGVRDYKGEMIIDDLQDQEGKEDENTDEDMDSRNGDVDDETEPMESNSKRQTRTQSLEEATTTPVPKRHTYRGSMLERASAAAIDLEDAYIVDSVGEVPTTFKSAMESSDADKWEEACNSEFEPLCKNDTWELVSLPRDRKAISIKWVFKVKETVEGLIERYKARRVTKGFLQKYGVDFQETFAPVAKFTSITDHLEH